MMLLAVLPAFACPVLGAEVERATLALIDGDLVVSRDALDSAATSFGCTPAALDDVVRYWVMEGAYRQVSGEDPTAWLAAAHAVSDNFDPRHQARLHDDVRAHLSGADQSDADRPPLALPAVEGLGERCAAGVRRIVRHGVLRVRASTNVDLGLMYV
jgi:hypothetical protein